MKAVRQLLLFAVLRAGFCFFYFNIVPCSQPAEGFNIGVFFMLHDKADGIATFSATKAFVYFLGRRNGKGGRFFIVERAVADIVGSPSFQLNKCPNDIMDIDPVLNFLYGLW